MLMGALVACGKPALGAVVVVAFSVQALVKGLTCSCPPVGTVLTKNTKVALAISALVIPAGKVDKSKFNKALLLALMLTATDVPALVAAKCVSAISGNTTAWAAKGLKPASNSAVCKGFKVNVIKSHKS